jgi:hypothetical protein
MRDSDTTLKIHCNAGKKEVNQIGTLKKYGTMWYSESAIANILSPLQIKKRSPIKYDNTNSNQSVACIATTPRIGSSLWSTPSRITEKGSLIVTVTWQIKLAKRLLWLATHSNGASKTTICSNMIKKCPVTSTDINININNANKLCGTYLATLKGKMVRHQDSSGNHRPEPKHDHHD